ncbi:MAG: sulfite exporter TauE/SafE family protein [Candidatus Karelsulcia muelleri]
MEKLNCLGIISSLHCFSMCGPIIFFFLKKKENKMKNKNEMLKKNFNNFNYQIGRIISYILLGYIFGTIGYRFNLIGYQKKTSLFLGGHLIMKNPLYFLLKKLFLKGLFNVLIPCSIVYIGNSLLGVIFMFYFGILLNNITLLKIIMGFILLIRGLGIIDFYPKLIRKKKIEESCRRG